MRRALCALVAVLIGVLAGCTAPPCDPGFELGKDGNCYQSKVVDSGDPSVDTAPETGDSGETLPNLRDITVEGSYAGANVIVFGFDTTPQAAFTAGLMPKGKAIADAGLVLAQQQCGASWTAPCMVSWALGTSAPVLGTTAYVPESVSIPCPVIGDDETTFADVLKGEGYHTVLITQNGFYGDVTNTDQGFSTYLAVKGTGEGAAAVVEETQAAMDGGQPFYLHFHSKGGHEPYIDPEEPEAYYTDCLTEVLPDGIDFRRDRQNFEISQLWESWSSDEQDAVEAQWQCVYAAQLRWVDDTAFGTVWDQLDQMGALDNALVYIMSDHGEEAGEHLDATSGWPNFGHNQSVYQQVSGVIGAYWAQDIAPGSVTRVTDQADVAPTLLNALGIPVPESMGGLPAGEIPSDRISLRYECGGAEGETPTWNMAAVAEDGSILHLNSDGGYESYQLSTDPSEAFPTGEIDEVLRGAVDELSARALSEHWCGGG